MWSNIVIKKFNKQLYDMEVKFKKCTKLHGDWTVDFPIKEKNLGVNQQQKTSKIMSDQFNFVPTPLFLVDKMILKDDSLSPNSITCDLCAGMGQYSIRLIRYLWQKFNINIPQYLKNNHMFTELLPENCACLVWIFGPKINLLVGDSLNIDKLTNEHGILFFNGKEWRNNSTINELLTYSLIYENKEKLIDIFKHSNDEEYLINELKEIEKIYN